ncbi:helix-turn-helix transcriptional regulator [Catenulispora subtropica]|uniref:XRE family transcriptional regulator n=1 Tax=Catenulispora subtropica TaxID=450798 RepID=A0ABP5DKJ2_9ACTN
MNIHTGSPNPTTALRTGPFADALRAAITARGLSLDSLQRHLADRGVRVGTATLSCWQNGRRRPERPSSLRAVSALEDILGLPSGSLLVLLGPPRPRGHGIGLPAGSREYRHILPTWAALTGLLASLGTAADTKLHIAAQHEQVWIDATGSSPRRETFQVLRAHQDSVDRYVAIVDADPGADIERVDLEALENCRVGRIRRDAEAGLLVAELLFDLTLRPNQTHLIRYAVVDRSAVECSDFHRGFRFPAGQYALQVRFDQQRLPVACFAYQGSTEQELPMTGHHAVHINVAPVPPGIVGIRWDWR